MKKLKVLSVLLGTVILTEVGESVYFYNRAMKRSQVKTERTMKMSGTDWSQYSNYIKECREKLLSLHYEDIYIKSRDNLKLHATYFPNGSEDKVVLCFHGYTGEGMKDNLAISNYYLKKGYSLLLIDARAHGKSEGAYIGFGCLDRYDAICWINYIIDRCGKDIEILLHGTSMGGATVLMTSGLELPVQVKGIVSDCGFTSAKKVFEHVLRSMYHLPSFPVISIADIFNRSFAKYSFNDCDASEEVRKAKIPILLIHGDSDTFVPVKMCDEIYENISSFKQKLIVSGATHAESYYKDRQNYEKTLDSFLLSVQNNQK